MTRLPWVVDPISAMLEGMGWPVGGAPGLLRPGLGRDAASRFGRGFRGRGARGRR